MSGSGSMKRAQGVGSHGWWAAVVESVESRLWPLPLATVSIAVVVGILLPRFDVLIDANLPTAVDSAVFNGGADTARSVLSSIAGSLITATSLTFSLTVVALQLASSQASPRVLRLFARDRQVHWTLAAFLGTFAYSITVLRSVRSAAEDETEFVPRLAVTLAFVLTLLSVITLVFFLAHLAAQLRVETMLKEIHAETDDTIERIGARYASARAYEHPIHVPAVTRAVTAGSSGFVTGLDQDLLVQSAAEHGVVIQEARRVGESVIEGTPLAWWWRLGDGDELDSDAIDKAVRHAYSIGYERTASQDIDFGVQQILDIGVRALSAGVNDPTTAVHALGHLGAITARAVSMPRCPAGLAGEHGELRVVTAARGATEAIDEALSPMRHYCADHPAVVMRFVHVVDELAYVSRDSEVHEALLRQLEALVPQLQGGDDDPATRVELLSAVRRVQARMRQRAGLDGQ